MRQLTIPEFLKYLDDIDTTQTKDLDSTPTESNNTKLELLTSAYLDALNAKPDHLTIEQANVLKILFELAR